MIGCVGCKELARVPGWRREREGERGGGGRGRVGGGGERDGRTDRQTEGERERGREEGVTVKNGATEVSDAGDVTAVFEDGEHGE